jgi:hypothetical protein
MLTASRTESDAVARALARIADRGVLVEPWLADGQAAGPDHPHQPVLYLVEPGVDPPRSWDELEDWARLPTTPDELFARADRLLLRAWQAGSVPIEVDEFDVLYVGRDRIFLSELEARLMRLLLDRRGELVARAPAIAAMWPDGSPDGERAIDNRLRHLRARLWHVPLRIRTARGKGFILEWDAAAAAARDPMPVASTGR